MLIVEIQHWARQPTGLMTVVRPLGGNESKIQANTGRTSSTETNILYRVSLLQLAAVKTVP